MASFCENCGERIEGGRFCSACGTPVDDAGEQIAGEQPRAEDNATGWVSPSGEIIQGPDGVYRWAYDFNMFKNPTIFITILKVLGISLGAVWAFVWIIDVFSEIFKGRFEFSDFLEITKVFFLIFIGMMVLLAISYAIYAGVVLGGKYCVLFEMDENGVTHTMAPKQFKKAQIVALISALTAKNVSTVGTAMLAGSKNAFSSTWEYVKSVQCYPGRNVIKVNELLNKNQVYASDEDFKFVRDYIVSHCTNAKIKG